MSDYTLLNDVAESKPMDSGTKIQIGIVIISILVIIVFAIVTATVDFDGGVLSWVVIIAMTLACGAIGAVVGTRLMDCWSKKETDGGFD